MSLHARTHLQQQNSLIKAAYLQSSNKGDLDIDQFLTWYVANMFTEVSTMSADTGQLQSETLIYRLARHHNVDSVQVLTPTTNAAHRSRGTRSKLYPTGIGDNLPTDGN